MAGQLQTFLIRPHCENFNGLFDQVAQVELDRLEFDMTGLDF
jgi:hypothetical protein